MTEDLTKAAVLAVFMLLMLLVNIKSAGLLKTLTFWLLVISLAGSAWFVGEAVFW